MIRWLWSDHDVVFYTILPAETSESNVRILASGLDPLAFPRCKGQVPHRHISGTHGGEYEDDFSEMLSRVVLKKLTDVSEVLTASIII
jgi:hypothetical protein